MPRMTHASGARVRLTRGPTPRTATETPMPDPDTRFDGRAPDGPGAPGDADLLAVFPALPAPAVLFAADAPRFTLVAVSDALMAATQRPRESFIGLPLAEAFPVSQPGPAEAGDVDGLRASLEAAVRTGTPQRMARQRYDLQRPDGGWEQRGWDALNTPVAGPDGAVRWILHQIEDIALPTRVDHATAGHAAAGDEHAGETPRE